MPNTKDKYLKEREAFEKKFSAAISSNNCMEDYTWGEVWSFIVALLDKKEKETRKEVIKMIKNIEWTEPVTDDINIYTHGYNQAIDDILKTIK